ncbi:protein CEPU-1 [Trichonephila clavipes]|nr:protein CEPU-1 [Trichonephila clavipes]
MILDTLFRRSALSNNIPTVIAYLPLSNYTGYSQLGVKLFGNAMCTSTISPIDLGNTFSSVRGSRVVYVSDRGLPCHEFEPIPPHIEEEETSSDTEVREGSDVSLRCVAKGSPDPETTWRREDGQEITIGRKKVSSVKSTELNITKVGRLQMGAYLCIASNGVQPSVSKRIVLNVNFPPMIWIPSQLVGAPVGTDVTLACNLESFPQSVTYWNRESGTMVLTNDKYNSVLLNKGLYKISMQLTIRNLKPEDFGAYTCVAKNSLGETEGTIRLYEIPPPSSPATSQGPEPLRPKSEKLRNGHPQNAQAKTEETGSTEVQYGPSPSFNASSFSSENYFPPTNSNTEPGAATISSAAEKLTSLYLYYVLYFVVCQWFSFRGIS